MATVARERQPGAKRHWSSRLRDEMLNENLFFGLTHARKEIAAWASDYNTERTHSALGCQTPAEASRLLKVRPVRSELRRHGKRPLEL